MRSRRFKIQLACLAWNTPLSAKSSRFPGESGVAEAIPGMHIRDARLAFEERASRRASAKETRDVAAG